MPRGSRPRCRFSGAGATQGTTVLRRHLDSVVIALAGLFAYLPALFGEFVYDDLHSVRDNTALRSLAELPRLLWDVDAFSSLDARMYRPVLLVSFALDHAMAGGAVFVFKFTDILIHICCAVLIASIVRGLRGGRGPALIAGLLFAVHPLASEAVNMVSSRSDQMLALGALLAMRWHLAAMNGSRRAWIGTAFATLLACGCKETGVIIPALLLVLEGLRATRRGLDWRGAVARVAPSAGTAVVYLVLRRMFLGIATVAIPNLTVSTDVTSGGGRSLVTQFDAMAQVLPRFVAQAVAPFGLTLDPPLSFHAAWSVAATCGVLALAALTWLGLRAPRRRPLAFAGTCLAWAAALPWVLIPLNAPAGEHRVYASLAGICLCVATLVPRDVMRRRVPRAGLMLVLVLFAVGAATRSAEDAHPESLWRATLAGNPESAAALASLADIHRDRALQSARGGDQAATTRELRMAIVDVDRALSLQPRNVPMRKAAARLRLLLGPERGRPAIALVHAERLLARRADDPILRILVAETMIATGSATGEARFFTDGEHMALSCLDVAEPKGLVYRVAAEAREAAGDLDGALAQLDASIARGLDHVSVRCDRARVLLRLGRRAEARQEIARVLAVDPFQPDARRMLEELTAAAPGH